MFNARLPNYDGRDTQGSGGKRVFRPLCFVLACHNMALVRYPEWYAPNAKAVLRSLIPAVAQRCMFFFTSPKIMTENIRGTKESVSRKMVETIL